MGDNMKWNNASFSDECKMLLDYLANGGKQTYRDMEQSTGIPWTRIRRMIEPVCMEKRSQEEFIRYMDTTKKSTYFASRYFLSLNGDVYINYSLNEGFLYNARVLGYSVKYIPIITGMERKRGNKLSVIKEGRHEHSEENCESMMISYEDKESFWAYCDKCRAYTDYDGNEHCHTCGNKLEIGKSIEKDYITFNM